MAFSRMAVTPVTSSGEFIRTNQVHSSCRTPKVLPKPLKYEQAMPRVSQLTELAKRAATEVGFDLAGVAGISDYPELDYFANWIADGLHGEMRYMESRDAEGRLKRASLKHAAPWAKSVIVCAVNYNTAQPYSTELGYSTKSPDSTRANGTRTGWISRYAWSHRDYHDVLLPRLREVEARLKQQAGDIRTWCYVDTGPVIERVLAKYAGVGWVGKNTCIINQQLGSWLFLGVILTSLELEPDIPAADRCGTCTRCLDACPTDAFQAPRKLNASRCISYLTIEKRGAIPEDQREGIGQHVYGCDICQDVCPWNNQKGQKAPVTPMLDLQPRERLVAPDLEWLATISEEDFRETFRGSPMKRAKRTAIRRNAVVAMGNSGDLSFAPTLRFISETDEDAVVREHAEWALHRLRSLGSQ